MMKYQYSLCRISVKQQLKKKRKIKKEVRGATAHENVAEQLRSQHKNRKVD